MNKVFFVIFFFILNDFIALLYRMICARRRARVQIKKIQVNGENKIRLVEKIMKTKPNRFFFFFN